MNRFNEEMSVIPRTAWAIAVCVYLALVFLLLQVVIPEDPKLHLWPSAGRMLFAAGIPLFPAVLILLIGYVNGDARRRGMRYVMWTLLAILIPNAIGIILYFILREPPLRGCPKCGAAVRSGFTFCPACGTAVARTCPACRCAVEPGWSHCTGCGTQLRAA
jgi:hypothetical protein